VLIAEQAGCRALLIYAADKKAKQEKGSEPFCLIVLLLCFALRGD